MGCSGVLGRCSSGRVSSSALSADACWMCRSLHQYCSPQYRGLTEETVTCPLAQSVERIHGKEKPGGLFSSSGDQQEQPLVQVNADRSIWIR